VLTMEKQNYLTNLSEFEGMSLRAISKRSGHHFNTVKIYVDKEDWNKEYSPRKQRPSPLDPLKPTIDEWPMEDMKRGRKEVNKFQHKRALALTARKFVRLVFRLLKDNRLYIPA